MAEQTHIRSAVQNWTKTKARTLAGAMRAASRAQAFQGSDIYVGELIDDKIVCVAEKLHRDALDMNATGNWRISESERVVDKWPPDFRDSDEFRAWAEKYPQYA